MRPKNPPQCSTLSNFYPFCVSSLRLSFFLVRSLLLIFFRLSSFFLVCLLLSYLSVPHKICIRLHLCPLFIISIHFSLLSHLSWSFSHHMTHIESPQKFMLMVYPRVDKIGGWSEPNWDLFLSHILLPWDFRHLWLHQWIVHS